MTQGPSSALRSNRAPSARYNRHIDHHRRVFRDVPAIGSADGRIEVLLNRRAGTGSLICLLQRRDRLIHAYDGVGRHSGWRPTRVAMVRHPLDRMVSAFFDMWIDQTNHSARAWMPVDVDDVSYRFDAFIDDAAIALSGAPARCDARLRPQVALLGGVFADHVGRLEQFEESVRVIEQMASIRLLSEDLWEHVHVNRSGAQRSSFRPTVEQLRKIRCLYERDFSAWGYDDACFNLPARRISVVGRLEGAKGITAR
jgi:Sulfotransferase family